MLPTAAVENMKTLADVRGDSLARRTFAMQLPAGFAIVGSVLTLVGTYGVLSRRRRNSLSVLQWAASIATSASDHGARACVESRVVSSRTIRGHRIFASPANIRVSGRAKRPSDVDRMRIAFAMVAMFGCGRRPG